MGHYIRLFTLAVLCSCNAINDGQDHHSARKDFLDFWKNVQFQGDEADLLLGRVNLYFVMLAHSGATPLSM